MKAEQLGFLEHQFDLPGSIKDISSLGSGHIHDTFLITCSDKDNSEFVLQKFNQKVFKNPLEVMSNIDKVLDHINRTHQSGSLEPLHIIRTRNHQLIFQDQQKNVYRLFNHIGHSESFDQVTHPEQARGGARAFGQFFELLSGLDPHDLYITIPEFHNLRTRFKQLQDAVDSDEARRVHQFKKEVEFAFKREPQVIQYSQFMENHEVPYRVTHNDTKINNVLFRKGTTEGICVVDLDTIMPGLLLFDFGDMGRTFCNAVLEEDSAENALFRLDMFKAVCDGFFGSIKTPLSSEEIESLKIGPWWLTYIMGIRFLADLLNGDIYYKINYPLQNLDRARNQLNLVADIEKKQSEINAIVEASVSTYAIRKDPGSAKIPAQ
jgi:thiamine kinase-like enzyme